MGAIYKIEDNYVRMYIYGGIPAILTIREVSDVLSDIIDETYNHQTQNINNLKYAMDTIASHNNNHISFKNKKVIYTHTHTHKHPHT